MERIKVYGKKVSIHTENGWEKVNRFNRNNTDWDMCEIAYKVYDEDGSLVGAGTEDFTRERLLAKNLKSEIYQIVRDSGEKYPSGNTKWEQTGTLFMQAAKSDWSKARRVVGRAYAVQGLKLR